MIETDKAIRAIMDLRVRAEVEEYDIHRLIAEALTGAGVSYEHEKKLSAGGRIDFLADGLGIEVKKGKPDRKSLISQIARYAASPEIVSVAIVCQREVKLPDEIGGKRVHMISLNRLWGVALP